ncbi:MAG: DUF488 domain-containing protein [Flavisolibacter sp.]|jgi:uncharacterized protein YeaO (DUF488 family)
MKISIKRIYEPPAKEDGTRILIDRLWPRGLTKEKAAIDLWLKDIAPSAALRQWFAHDPGKWQEFQKRYRKELKENKDAVFILKQEAKNKTVTLLYAAKDEVHNDAVVLKEFLSKE